MLSLLFFDFLNFVEMVRETLRTLARDARRVMNLGMLGREHRWAEATSDLVTVGLTNS